MCCAPFSYLLNISFKYLSISCQNSNPQPLGCKPSPLTTDHGCLSVFLMSFCLLTVFLSFYCLTVFLLSYCLSIFELSGASLQSHDSSPKQLIPRLHRRGTCTTLTHLPKTAKKPRSVTTLVPLQVSVKSVSCKQRWIKI